MSWRFPTVRARMTPMVNKPFVFQDSVPKNLSLYRVSIHYLPTDRQWIAYVYRMGSNLPAWTSPKYITFLGCTKSVDKWLKGKGDEIS